MTKNAVNVVVYVVCALLGSAAVVLLIGICYYIHRKRSKPVERDNSADTRKRKQNEAAEENPYITEMDELSSISTTRKVRYIKSEQDLDPLQEGKQLAPSSSEKTPLIRETEVSTSLSNKSGECSSQRKTKSWWWSDHVRPARGKGEGDRIEQETGRMDIQGDAAVLEAQVSEARSSKDSRRKRQTFTARTVVSAFTTIDGSELAGGFLERVTTGEEHAACVRPDVSTDCLEQQTSVAQDLYEDDHPMLGYQGLMPITEEESHVQISSTSSSTVPGKCQDRVEQQIGWGPDVSFRLNPLVTHIENHTCPKTRQLQSQDSAHSNASQHTDSNSLAVSGTETSSKDCSRKSMDKAGDEKKLSIYKPHCRSYHSFPRAMGAPPQKGQPSSRCRTWSHCKTESMLPVHQPLGPDMTRRLSEVNTRHKHCFSPSVDPMLDYLSKLPSPRARFLRHVNSPGTKGTERAPRQTDRGSRSAKPAADAAGTKQKKVSTPGFMTVPCTSLLEQATAPEQQSPEYGLTSNQDPPNQPSPTDSTDARAEDAEASSLPSTSEEPWTGPDVSLPQPTITLQHHRGCQEEQKVIASVPRPPPRRRSALARQKAFYRQQQGRIAVNPRPRSTNTTQAQQACLGEQDPSSAMTTIQSLANIQDRKDDVGQEEGSDASVPPVIPQKACDTPMGSSGRKSSGSESGASSATTSSNKAPWRI